MFAAGAPAQTLLGELTALPQILRGGGKRREAFPQTKIYHDTTARVFAGRKSDISGDDGYVPTLFSGQDSKVMLNHRDEPPSTPTRTSTATATSCTALPTTLYVCYVKSLTSYSCCVLFLSEFFPC